MSRAAFFWRMRLFLNFVLKRVRRVACLFLQVVSLEELKGYGTLETLFSKVDLSFA